MRCSSLILLLLAALVSPSHALRSPVGRRAVLAGAAATVGLPAANAYDLPALEEFDDPKARAFYASKPNPGNLGALQSKAFYTVATFDQSTLQKMDEAGWPLAKLKDTAGKTVLHLAAQRGNVQAVALLIKSGSNVDAVTSFGETPLHMATRNNRLDCVKALLDAGASTSIKTVGGDTALSFANKYKFQPVADALGSK